MNTGIYNGLLTGQKNDGRPWLISIHCVSHRVELAIKDSLLKEERFRAVKQFVIDLFYLFKRSCKIKRHFNGLAATLDVQVYSTLKVHGTRFVNHVCSGLARLLNNWPVLMQTLENAVELQSFRNLKPKLQIVLKKLKNFTFHLTCGIMKQVLDNFSKLSLVLEKGDVKVFDILPTVEKTKSRNEDTTTCWTPAFT